MEAVSSDLGTVCWFLAWFRVLFVHFLSSMWFSLLAPVH